MEDTLTLSRQHRQQQGSWEVEVSYGGEVDLHKHFVACDKNPGHQKFIPIDKFNIDHLPAGCTDSDIVCLVQAMGNLTVRVSVTYVSEMRPSTVPGTDKPYPCYQKRGKNMLRCGTGWVCGVKKFPDKNTSHITCDCNACMNSPTPKTQFAQIQIITAAHVVFDDLEGAHTTCHLFYDNGSKPSDCVGAVTLHGMSDVMSNVDRDWCEMTYYTHDVDLANILSKMVNQWNCLERRLGHRYGRLKKRNSASNTEETSDACLRMSIIVSHPHGCNKQVSFGHYIEKDDSQESWANYIYTTATCPGSSGARVWLTGWGDYGFLYYIRTHCGNCEWNKELNYASIGYPTGKR